MSPRFLVCEVKLKRSFKSIASYKDELVYFSYKAIVICEETAENGLKIK